MPKQKLTSMQQNQVSDIPNDNNEIEAKEDTEVKTVILDSIENQESPLDLVETVEHQDVNKYLSVTVVKVKKPRAKQEQVIPVIIEESQDVNQDQTEPVIKVTKTRVNANNV